MVLTPSSSEFHYIEIRGTFILDRQELSWKFTIVAKNKRSLNTMYINSFIVYTGYCKLVEVDQIILTKLNGCLFTLHITLESQMSKFMYHIFIE